MPDCPIQSERAHIEKMIKLKPFSDEISKELKSFSCAVGEQRGGVGGMDAKTVGALTKVAAVCGMMFVLYTSMNETDRAAGATCTGGGWRASMLSGMNGCETQDSILKTTVKHVWETGSELLGLTARVTAQAIGAAANDINSGNWYNDHWYSVLGGRKTRRRKSKARKSKARKKKSTRKRH